MVVVEDDKAFDRWLQNFIKTKEHDEIEMARKLKRMK